jgi:hypothetical protein
MAKVKTLLQATYLPNAQCDNCPWTADGINYTLVPA